MLIQSWWCHLTVTVVCTCNWLAFDALSCVNSFRLSFLSTDFIKTYLLSQIVFPWEDSSKLIISILQDFLCWSTLLTHWGLVTHVCIHELGHHCLQELLVACSKWKPFIIWPNADLSSVRPLGIKIWKIFFQENAFENVMCKMAAILFRPQFINALFVDCMLSSEGHPSQVFMEPVLQRLSKFL